MNKQFREAVLDEMDECYEQHDGETPDHIIVSNRLWEGMKEHKAFETLRNPDSPERRRGAPLSAERGGYLGMRVWPSGALDKRRKDALLLSEEAFKNMLPTPKDF